MSKITNNLKIASRKFVINRKNSICDAFIYNPINIEESGLGSLFVIGEAFYTDERKSKDIAYIINQTASHIKKEYYGNKRRCPHDSFEEAVKRANIFLAEFIAEKKFFNVKNLNFIISSFSGQNFYFTACGMPKIFLLRGDSLINIEKKLLLPEKTSPSKVFVNIANGKLIKGDLLLLINSGFADLLPQITLKTIMLNNNFETIYEYISKTIKKDNNELSYGMILLNTLEEKMGPVVRYSYEELKKISGNANEKMPNNVIPQEEIHTEQMNKQKINSRFSIVFKALLKFTIKICSNAKKITLIFIGYSKRKIFPYFKKIIKKMPLIKNQRTQGMIKKALKNKIILAFGFIIIIAIIIFITHMLKKETIYLVK